MTFHLSGKEHVHSMSPKNHPVLTVPSGARIILEIDDALSGQVTEDRVLLPPEQWEPLVQAEVNPATGPIFVEGAAPGDVLAVRILAIRPVGRGFAGVGMGALGGRITTPLIRFFDSDQETMEFAPGIVLQAEPMVGVIGVAPLEAEVSTRHPGDHGGNLDTRLVKVGATVYLPVFVPGALLAIGDVHVVMGDGEVNGQGIESRAEVEIQVEVLKGQSLKRPLIETDDLWVAVASHQDLGHAIQLAVEDMTDFLAKRLQMALEETFLLIGLAGQVRICQVVNPLATVRVEFPKGLLPGGPS